MKEKSEYIYKLIDRMNTEEDFKESSNSISWQAYREAEEISNELYYPILFEVIKKSAKDNKRDRDIRIAAYFIWGNLLKNIPSKDYLEYYISQLKIETNKYIVSSMLDRLVDITIDNDISIDIIIELSRSDKWQIRHSAISALGSHQSKDSKEALRYYVDKTDYKNYKYEINYANAALGKIGDLEDIEDLELHVKLRYHDIKASALFAIESIKKRSII